MESILPRDLINLTLSYLPPYAEVMVASLEEPQQWELRCMASRGLVTDPSLLQWAIHHGLPEDDRLACSKAFYGMPIQREHASDRALYAAAAGNNSYNYIQQIMDMMPPLQEETMLRVCDILVKREHTDTIAALLDNGPPQLRYCLLRESLPKSRNEECMNLYVRHADTEDEDAIHLRDVMRAANGPLLERMMMSSSSTDEWFYLFGFMALYPHPETITAILRMTPPEHVELMWEALQYSECGLLWLADVLMAGGMEAEGEEFARAFLDKYAEYIPIWRGV